MLRKYAFVVFVLAFPTIVFSQQPQTVWRPEMHHCSAVGAIYERMAETRDEGLSPQKALEFIRKTSLGWPKEKGGEFTLQELKDIINTVYFDKRFENAGGRALANQMREYCLYPNGRGYTPLK